MKTKKKEPRPSDDPLDRLWAEVINCGNERLVACCDQHCVFWDFPGLVAK